MRAIDGTSSYGKNPEPGRAPRIHSELLKLGFDVAQLVVLRPARGDHLFVPSIGCLGVYTVAVAGLARSTESHPTRNGPAPHGIASIWKYRLGGRWRGGRPGIALKTRQLISEMARANFFWHMVHPFLVARVITLITKSKRWLSLPRRRPPRPVF
jgi:hypothetical protein